MGAAPTAPQGQSRFDAGRRAKRERHSSAPGSDGRSEGAHNLALNSIWKRRGSLYDAVYGTPTAADRLLRFVT